jgi:hypothetical protein
MNPGQNLFIHELIDIDAAEPRWPVVLLIVFVEGVDHLSYLVESIDKKKWLFLVRVAKGLHNFAEPVACHVRLESKSSPL